MAQVLPAKRSHDLTPVDAFAGPTRSKRPRYSIEPSAEPTEQSDTEYSNDADPVQAIDEDEDAAYVRATQIVEKTLRKAAPKENIPAEHGIIEEIKCTNFMCHEQLTVTLGPLINFIIGHNGSGKSAVLTALTLCLGGKATATNRGQNLKSFIKEGRESANLAVRIKNQGSLAYKPEQYGDSIVVERHFSKTGTSGFKLKDRNGRIVSTKKAELEDIIDAFAMQIDNPLNVLTQDMARQFLNDSGPKEKYKFFLKGTQLETLDRDYAQIGQELEEQEAKAKTLRDDVQFLRKSYDEAQKKVEALAGFERSIADERKLAHQSAWAEVISQERELERREEGIRNQSSVVDEKRETADTESVKYARADEALSNAKKEVEELEAELQPTLAGAKSAKSEWEETRSKIGTLKVDERRIGGAIQSIERSIENTQSQIEDHRERQAQADNGLHARKIREFEEARVRYEEFKLAWEDHDGTLPALTKDLEDARGENTRARGLLEQKKRDEIESKSKLRKLENGQHNWIESYPKPQVLDRLMRAIEQEKRFQERPVGPMGRYVELIKPEWTHILEKSFGGSLNGFVVTSKPDQILLFELLKRFEYEAPVFIGKKDPIDTSGHEPDKQLLTWMRALNITNDLVQNQLIIMHRIDQVVLIPRRSDAMKLAYGGASSLRRNVVRTYCFHDSTRRKGHSYSWGETGSVNMSPIDEYRGHPRMQSDNAPRIQDEKDNLVSIQQQIRSLEVEHRVVQDKVNACQARIQNHNRTKRQLKERMDCAQEDRDRLEEEVSASTPDAAQIEELEKEKEDFEERLRLDREQFEDLVMLMDEAKREAQSQKAASEAAEGRVQEIQFKIEKIRAKIETLMRRREQALRGKNTALDEVARAEEEKSSWERSRDMQAVELENTIRQAQAICPRVDVPEGETFASLEQKRQIKIRERERQEKLLGGSRKEISDGALRAKKIWVDASLQLRATDSVRRVLKQALNNRKERWLRFRQEISCRARVTFNYMLSERQFRGSLAIDHHGRRLDIHVQPDITVAGAAARQTKTLSGGEKSFSTICLLLSLWEAMGSPIRCLDEFDVFMDNVNREITMEMIVEAARKATGRQYILITPQAMTNKKVHSMDDVRIIRMSDPERGQTALNFGR